MLRWLDSTIRQMLPGHCLSVQCRVSTQTAGISDECLEWGVGELGRLPCCHLVKSYLIKFKSVPHTHKVDLKCFCRKTGHFPTPQASLTTMLLVSGNCFYNFYCRTKASAAPGSCTHHRTYSKSSPVGALGIPAAHSQ